MRRIYLLIAMIACGVSFYAGYLVGTPTEETADIAAIQSERDSLTTRLDGLLSTIDVLKKQSEQAREKIKETDILLKKQERTIAATKKHYEKEIAKVRTYTIPQIDSLFTTRYPILDSSNTGIWLPEERARLIAVVPLQLDSCRSINAELLKTISIQDTIISATNALVELQDETIAQQDTALAVIQYREQTWIEESNHWKGKSKKYKRQRNLTIAGVGIVVVTFILKSL